MRKTTDTFSFEIPDAWEVFPDAGQLVVQGPEGEEIILTSAAVSGPAGPERDRLTEELLDNAQRSMESAAAHPDLRITSPLRRDADTNCGYPCWTLIAETRKPEVIFAQAVIRGPAGVMLITFESPHSQEHLSWFRNFLATFGPPV